MTHRGQIYFQKIWGNGTEFYFVCSQNTCEVSNFEYHCGIDNMASIGKFLQHLPASSRDAGLPKIFSKTTVVSAATTRGFSNRMVCLRRLKIAAPFRWLNPEHIELIWGLAILIDIAHNYFKLYS